MKPIIIINTFESVFFDQNRKPIVICDIDHTFLRPIRNYNDVYNQVKSDYLDHKQIDQYVNYLLDMSINFGLIKQTDENGFSLMLDKIQKLRGKLIFLTARSAISHAKTLADLNIVGLNNISSYEIHYTGNQCSKGDYIRNHNLLKDYNHHIFIDDFPHFLESALKIYPDMDCYLFKYDR